jgi:hypothetical protein
MEFVLLGVQLTLVCGWKTVFLFATAEGIPYIAVGIAARLRAEGSRIEDLILGRATYVFNTETNAALCSPPPPIHLYFEYRGQFPLELTICEGTSSFPIYSGNVLS